jgi:hypothetical protein
LAVVPGFAGGKKNKCMCLGCQGEQEVTGLFSAYFLRINKGFAKHLREVGCRGLKSGQTPWKEEVTQRPTDSSGLRPQEQTSRA